MTKKPFYERLHQPFKDKFKEFGFEYDRGEDLYEAMRTIHRLVNSRALVIALSFTLSFPLLMRLFLSLDETLFSPPLK